MNTLAPKIQTRHNSRPITGRQGDAAYHDISAALWGHDLETLSASLAICEGI